MPTEPMKKYGWIPSLPDYRDVTFTFEAQEAEMLPASVDLRPNMPPVYDQGQLGSCTANAIAGAIQYDQIKNHNKYLFAPSRLFIYYQERALENSISSDSGAMIRDGVKACSKVGACPEYRWPYDINKFADNPNHAAYWSASVHKIQTYQSVNQTLTDIQVALSKGYPVIFGFTVYDAFESEQVAQTGELNLPTKGEQMVGGHAVLIVGYDNATQRFIVRNSWGDAWGAKGYFTMPYAYATNPNLADDFWVIYTTN